MFCEDLDSSAWVECVPNISEGRNLQVIQSIVEVIEKVPNVYVLHVDSSSDANRSVITFVGSPPSCIEAGFRLAEKALELIDMRKHQGVHPRLGAVDVFPFVPLRNITMEECVVSSKQLAKRIGEELQVPVYLYGESATVPHRRELSSIRAGGYEKLKEKLADPLWHPDFGPSAFIPESGAVIVGARNILIAYNINLNTKDVRIASTIAGHIRESGIKRKTPKGEIQRVPGLFKACKAIGWYLEKYGIAQVSTNLTDFRLTFPHQVYEACRFLAHSMGVEVTGSEVVGLIPLEAILEAGRFFYSKQGKSETAESLLIESAIQGLGLNDLYPFRPEEKILEYVLQKKVLWREKFF